MSSNVKNLPSTHAVRPVPRQIKRLTELRSIRPVSEYLPAISPVHPAHGLANSLIHGNRQAIQGLTAAVRGTHQQELAARSSESVIKTAAMRRVASIKPPNTIKPIGSSIAKARPRVSVRMIRKEAAKKALSTSGQRIHTLLEVNTPPAALSRIPTIGDFGRVRVEARMASGEVIHSTARIPPLHLTNLLPVEIGEKARRFYEELDRVEVAWADDALWFVFSRFTYQSMFLFNRLKRPEQVEAATLDALERLCQQDIFIKVLHEAIRLAPHMSDYQQDILVDALSRVQKGEYRLALSHLMDGLEGALTRVAVERSIIDEDRWLVGKPRNKKNRLHSVDRVIKEMALDEDYSRFLHRGIFGERGNAVRHGEPKDDERRRALLIVVALTGWLDAFMSLQASSALVNAMSVFLPETVSRQRQLTA